MRLRAGLVIALAITIAITAWPAFITGQVSAVRAAALVTPAPVARDYEQRNTLVAFWEGAVREHHRNDMLSPRQLAGQYLQRFRETGDIDDVVRAQHMAEQSLEVMPHNVAATIEMAGVMLTLHRFREAVRDIDELLAYDPTNVTFLSQRAGLQMELGEYAQAAASLRRIRPADVRSPVAETVRSRYDELTGSLTTARALLDDAMTQVDAHVDASAQARAWYHVRAGELAFNSGDTGKAVRDEDDALAIFPTYNLAFKDLARFELALHHNEAALEAATAGARVTPFAETLGYESDAQAALGDPHGAAVTRDVIFAIERLGNVYRVNDRLLAMYYADHRLRAADALSIARRDASVRGDEIYAQDTLAWAAAIAGRWGDARRAAAKAIRYNTQDPSLQYHAGIIALHFGDRGKAARCLRKALELNPQFHPVFADDARQKLAQL